FHPLGHTDTMANVADPEDGHAIADAAIHHWKAAKDSALAEGYHDQAQKADQHMEWWKGQKGTLPESQKFKKSTGHYTHENGATKWNEGDAPEGASLANLAQRTAVGESKNNGWYLRAANNDDAKAIAEAYKEVTGKELGKGPGDGPWGPKRAGATHHGNTSAFPHIFFGQGEEAKALASHVYAALDKEKAASEETAKPTEEKAPEEAPAKTQVPEPLDHGVLNIPGKTNGIDAELDKYKKTQAAAAKAENKASAAEFKADKEKAKALFEQYWPAILEKHGPKFGKKQLHDTLDSMVKWEPKKFITFMDKFKAEMGQEPENKPQEPAGEPEGAAAPATPEPRAQEPATPQDGASDDAKAYEARVQMYVEKGMSNGDAQGVVDAEIMTGKWKPGDAIEGAEAAPEEAVAPEPERAQEPEPEKSKSKHPPLPDDLVSKIASAGYHTSESHTYGHVLASDPKGNFFKTYANNKQANAAIAKLAAKGVAAHATISYPYLVVIDGHAGQPEPEKPKPQAHKDVKNYIEAMGNTSESAPGLKQLAAIGASKALSDKHGHAGAYAAAKQTYKAAEASANADDTDPVTHA
ncbi:MAG TPA: hypothetical protein VN436_08025, partial [Holophaga sp.]|nr:hypothetical protein [Holophaga sp.]